jgi:hypothetical protein
MHPGALLMSSTAGVGAITLGASPATFTPNQAGTAYIAGGTVTAISHNRAGVATTLGILSGSVRLRQGDSVTVTYAVVPTTAVFVPE